MRYDRQPVNSYDLADRDRMQTYRELLERGVLFLGEPQVQNWGSFAMLVDSEGNQIVLGQRAWRSPTQHKLT